MKGGWVYIMTNKPRGVLYIGVTAFLAERITQHREDRGAVFCRRYGLHTLVYAEPHDSIELAIAREKAWKREWKIRLIEEANPDWRDLYGDIL